MKQDSKRFETFVMYLIFMLPWLLSVALWSCDNSEFKGAPSSDQRNSDARGGADYGPDSDNYGYPGGSTQNGDGGNLGDGRGGSDGISAGDGNTGNGLGNGNGNADDSFGVQNGGNLPTGLISGTGGNLAPPSYGTCQAATLQNGNTVCPANHVAVGINDGSSHGLACCPWQGANIFSSNSAELNQPRQGSCLQEEVMVGYQGRFAGVICSRIHQTLTVAPGGNAVLSNGNSGDQALDTFARMHASDGCGCRTNFVLTGGPHGGDNSCAEQCGQVRQK